MEEAVKDLEVFLGKLSFYVDKLIDYLKVALLILIFILIVRLVLAWLKKISLRKWSRSNFMNISYIRKLDGYQFESYAEKQFRGLGFNSEKTSSSYDFGVDLILDNKYGVQLKNYTGSIGIAAIQEVYAGAHYYEKLPVVIGTNYFTKSAVELGTRLGVELIDLEDIKNWGNRYYTRKYLHQSGVYELTRSKLTSRVKKKRVS